MALSCVGAQQGLGTVSGLMKWTWEEEEEKKLWRRRKKRYLRGYCWKWCPFWIIKHSCSNSGYIVLTFDEMIRLLTWLLHFSPRSMVTHKCLHNGMVCGVHVGVQREGTLSLAIVCCISFWSNDPVLRVEEKFRFVWLYCFDMLDIFTLCFYKRHTGV